MIKFTGCEGGEFLMSNLELVHFYENGSIYSFIKREEDDYSEYYSMRGMMKFPDELENFKINRYSSFLERGYSFHLLADMISNSIDVLNNYQIDENSWDWIYSERSALYSAGNGKKKMLLRK